VIIKVEQKHIDAGECREARKCAVALALVEAIPDISLCGVTSHDISVFNSGSGEQYFMCTPDLSRFINSFDSGEKVEPIEFEFPWPMIGTA
jgi:hypothetical protein